MSKSTSGSDSTVSGEGKRGEGNWCFESNQALTPTHILEYLYCPRFTFFEHVLGLPEYQERRLKVQRGREVHQERQQVNPGYLRKRLGVTKREHCVPLQSKRLNLSGVVDEVLWLEDGSMAPFDYKFAEYKERVFLNLRVQSALYGLLISEVYGKPVNRGFICYTRSRFKILEVSHDSQLMVRTLEAIRAVQEILEGGVFPPATRYQARCPDCCFRNICIR